MKLIAFRVIGFRSVEDSGWIEAEQVTSLIGTNESGKTNLLMPLWKLNPAKDGEINPTADYPRKRYNEIRSLEKKPIFIEARFELNQAKAAELAAMTGTTQEELSVVEISKDYARNLYFNFPAFKGNVPASKDAISRLMSEASSQIEALSAAKTEETHKSAIMGALAQAVEVLSKKAETVLSAADVDQLLTVLTKAVIENPLKKSAIVPRFSQALDALKEVKAKIDRPDPAKDGAVREKLTGWMPSFVYYSNYGNLDSEIYLPHVIENLKRKDIGSREEAKARTLKVLFEFVKLKPEEIQELGQELNPNLGRPTEVQVKQIADKKKERDILLQSASSELTQKFRDWWKQGEYRFRFQADGNHFRIWVSDDKRPEDIELEGRSTGLQWFLSFYLIFLVESANAHKGAILLLDEPGLSLHPLAQKDLSRFFENLSVTNQILFTTHSPFLVDADHLDRVKAVYVDDRGHTAVSSNLRASEVRPEQTKSIYSVHAALGLSVSDAIMQGCQAVIVEGPADQYYLSAMKNFLIGRQLISPLRELIFIPAGGVKGVSAVASIVTGKDEDYPFVILDADTQGQNLARQLKASLYNDSPDRILMMEKLTGLEHSEIEDLWPTSFIAAAFDRYLRGRINSEEEFSEVATSGPIVPQMEAFAQKHSIELKQPGWKAELARSIKSKLTQNSSSVDPDSKEVKIWISLFSSLSPALPAKASSRRN